MGEIDLHVHTTASDGTTSPEDTVHLAAEKGLMAIAITDHDTISGVAAAETAGKYCGMEVIPGIECSASYCNCEVHILGYFIDVHSEKLNRTIQWLVDDRKRRNRLILNSLAADGFDISEQAIVQKYPDTVIGRPHIAEYLMEKGYGHSVRSVFDAYLNVGRKYYFPRTFMTYTAAIQMLKSAGGVPVLAHPTLNVPAGKTLRQMTADMVNAGILGIETVYSTYTSDQEQEIRSLAEEFNLCMTGGSDFHGTRKPNIEIGCGRGSLHVPYTFLISLKEKIGK
jgi:predicted metal-dependent phosphoesterase TrpH